MELCRLRERSGRNLERVGGVLGRSANTLSRLERGVRPDITPAEVSALLAAMGHRRRRPRPGPADGPSSRPRSRYEGRLRRGSGAASADRRSTASRWHVPAT
ncbi:helix-turn-helix domain-containing protein [Actinophytocola gossypii]